MYRSVLHIIYTLFIIVGFSQQMDAQQSSSPVGVNFIIVNFDQPPTTLSVDKAPLKYNKDFALSMQIDDANLTLFTHGFPVFEGGEVNGTTYPGLYYTNGCGDSINFRMSSAAYIFNSNEVNSTDVHVDNSFGQLTWTQLDTIYSHKWGIQNHGVNGNKDPEAVFMDYSIKRNRSYIRRKLFNSTDGGVITSVFVNPGGQVEWTTPSLNLDNIGALNQNVTFPIGTNGGNVNNPAVDWTQPYSLLRRMEDGVNVSNLADLLANSSVGGANYWCPIFTHSIGNDYSFSSFLFDFNYIANTYGVSGSDNILMAADEEILNYLMVRDAITVNYVINGSMLLITFAGDVPDDLLYYSSSLVIESDAVINSIQIDGTTDYTINGIGTTNSLINVNWDGHVVIPADYLADSMVTVASNDPTEFNCWIAMDYVITLENGSHKDSLRQVLCDISGIVYDDGFCDCSINLQPADTTIVKDSCLLLNGAVGDYTYEWYIGDLLIGTGQDIYRCPIDTTQYNQIATNSFGCAAEDSIMVNVHSFSFDLGSDTTICEGSCITLTGPPHMREYYWYVADSIYDSIHQVIQPCPIDTTQYILVVEDTIGAQATDTIMVNIRLNPPVFIQPIDSTINYGDCIDLYGPDTNFTYQWFKNDTLLIDSLYTINTCPIDTALYKLIVTDTFGCQSEDSTHVYLNFLSFNLGNDTTICEGSCIPLSGPPDMVSYEWRIADTLYANTQSIEPCPEDSTMYTLWIENDIGATAHDSIIVTLKPTPTVFFEADTLQACAGDSIVISVVASEDVEFYTWYYLGEDSTTTSNSITLHNLSVGISNFYVVVEAENGCTAISNVELEIHDYPEIIVTNDTAVCLGDSIKLSIIGGNYYYWISNDDTISTDSAIYVKPIEQTNYIAQAALDTLLCYSVDTVSVQVHEPALTNIKYDTNIVCTYETVILEAEGADSYFWMPGGDTTSNYSFVISDTTTIWLTGTSVDGCTTTDSAIFLTRYQPEVSFTGLLPAFCISDDPVILTGNPPGGTFSGSGHLGGEFAPSAAGVGTHEIVYSYQPHPDSCYGYDTISTVVYGNDGEIDLGPDFDVTLYESKDLDAGEGFDSYYWNTGQTSQSITIYGTDKPQNGTYEYAVIGVINSCSTKGSVFVTFTNPDGYSEQQIHNLTVYPNPNTGRFSVMFSSTEKDILLRVTNLQGNLVYQQESIVCDENCFAKVDLEGIAPGFYILQLITPKGISTTKVILK